MFLDEKLRFPCPSCQLGSKLWLTPMMNWPQAEPVQLWDVMQLYSVIDRTKEDRIVRRAEASGCKAIFLTADSPILGVCYNEVRHDFKPMDGLSYPMTEKTSSDVQGEKHQDGFSTFGSSSHSWAKEISWLRSITKMEIWIKGSLTSEDVKAAIEYGCDGIIVSNHGGRPLDETPATIDALPACAKAAQGKIRFMLMVGSDRVSTTSKL